MHAYFSSQVVAKYPLLPGELAVMGGYEYCVERRSWFSVPVVHNRSPVWWINTLSTGQSKGLWPFIYPILTQPPSITYHSHQPCQHRLSQATTPSTNSGHHWQCMAREHPFQGNYGASTNKQSERYENEQSEMPNGARAAFAWAFGP